jgi:DNA replication protein DnaC
MDGQGLGLVGPYGSGKCQCAVWAIHKMFKKHPFRGSDAQSLHEPKRRTASFFRAAQISKAIENLNRPEDSYEYAVASWTIEGCLDHELLLVSEIGEIPMDVSASAEFLNILAHRKVHRRPTVWTTQFSSAELEKRFNSRMGRLIVERLSKDGRILKLA